MSGPAFPHPPPCAQCHAEMREVTRIMPAVHQQGLVAYECSQCGHLTSVIVPAEEQASR